MVQALVGLKDRVLVDLMTPVKTEKAAVAAMVRQL